MRTYYEIEESDAYLGARDRSSARHPGSAPSGTPPRGTLGRRNAAVAEAAGLALQSGLSPRVALNDHWDY